MKVKRELFFEGGLIKIIFDFHVGLNTYQGPLRTVLGDDFLHYRKMGLRDGIRLITPVVSPNQPAEKQKNQGTDQSLKHLEGI
jgi:hypothetical protein